MRLARPRTRTALVGLAVLAVVVAGGLWLRTSPLVRADDVVVLGAQGPRAADVERRLERAGAQQSTLAVDRDALHGAVADRPEVAGLDVDAQPPHRLVIRVRSRPPVALVDGVPRSGDGTTLAGVPREGLPQAPAGRATDPALRLLAAAPAPMRERVARLVAGSDGFAATLRDGGPQLRLGDASAARRKWAAAARVLSDASAQGAEYVDVTLPERPAAGGFPPESATLAQPAASTGA